MFGSMKSWGLAVKKLLFGSILLLGLGSACSGDVAGGSSVDVGHKCCHFVKGKNVGCDESGCEAYQGDPSWQVCKKKHINKDPARDYWGCLETE